MSKLSRGRRVQNGACDDNDDNIVYGHRVQNGRRTFELI